MSVGTVGRVSARVARAMHPRSHMFSKASVRLV